MASFLQFEDNIHHDCQHTMSLLKVVTQPRSRKSSKVAPIHLLTSADLDSQSKVVTSIITPFGTWRKDQRPSERPNTTTMPKDSGTPLSPQPSHRRRLLSIGPYCPKRPTLRQIIANQSDEPWTLSVFTSYCETNLCAENLSFIQEAERYTERYKQWFNAKSAIPSDSEHSLAEDLAKQWRKILADYIISGGPRELNVESGVRREMLAVPETDFPPTPDHLDNAVRLTERLIEDSILPSFLNDIQPEQHSSDEYLDTEVHPPSLSSKANSIHVVPLNNISRPESRDKPVKSAGPHASSFSSVFRNQNPRSALPPDPPRSKPLALPAHRPKSMFAATKKQHSSSSGDGPSIDSLVLEDSTAAVASPVSSYSTSNTSPPMSPPPSEAGRPSRGRSDSAWKKFSSRLGFGRKRSGSRLRKAPGSAIEESPPP